MTPFPVGMQRGFGILVAEQVIAAAMLEISVDENIALDWECNKYSAAAIVSVIEGSHIWYPCYCVRSNRFYVRERRT